MSVLDSWILILSAIGFVYCVAWLVKRAVDAGAEYVGAWKAGTEGPAEPPIGAESSVSQ